MRDQNVSAAPSSFSAANLNSAGRLLDGRGRLVLRAAMSIVLLALSGVAFADDGSCGNTIQGCTITGQDPGDPDPPPFIPPPDFPPEPPGGSAGGSNNPTDVQTATDPNHNCGSSLDQRKAEAVIEGSQYPQAFFYLDVTLGDGSQDQWEILRNGSTTSAYFVTSTCGHS